MRQEIFALGFTLVLSACGTWSKNAGSVKPQDHPGPLASSCSSFAEKLSGALLVTTPTARYSCNFGYADDDTRAANGPAAIFNIASISKGFTAAAVLRLVEQGLLNIDAPLSSLFREYPLENLTREGQEVTIRHLLNHTSGLPEYYDNETIKTVAFQQEVSFVQVLAAIMHRPPAAVPGATFRYLNAGYVLLGEIVRRLTGEPYATFVNREVFTPAGVMATVGAPANQQVVRAYEVQGGERVEYNKAHNVKHTHDTDVFTDGSLFTNLENLDLWVRALSAGKVLNQQSLNQMWTPGLSNYGLGWYVEQDAHGPSIQHTGYWLGYSSDLRHYPEAGITIAFYSNQPLASEIEDQFIDQITKAAFTKHR